MNQIIVLGFALGSFSFSEGLIEIGNLLPIEQVKLETTVINSEQMLGLCLEEVQRQYFPVCIPSLSERLLQPAGSFPVDWEGFDPDTRKHFRGWVDGDGIVRYAVGLYEDYWTGEIVVLDDTGWEIFRIQRSRSYDPYDYQRALFSLGKKEVLEDEYTRGIFHPAKICTLLELVPITFWDAHLQVEQELAARELSAMPMMMAMGASTGISKPTARVEQAINGVDLVISLPVDFGRHLEIFRRDDLLMDSWAVANSWIPTFGNTTVVWNDPAAGDECFYHISNAVDSDGDGFSDLREVWDTGTNSNAFNTVTNDSDSMHDWWELKMFGDLDESDSDDFDGDGLSNIEEMIYISDAPPSITLISDPSLYDTDHDGLNDFDEVRGNPPTNPWDPDTSAPAVSIGSPANGITIAP